MTERELEVKGINPETKTVMGTFNKPVTPSFEEILSECGVDVLIPGGG